MKKPKIARPKAPPYKPNMGAPFPALLNIDAVQARLGAIFPQEFPDRGILVEKMAARVVFVFLYGGLLEGSGRMLRPSFVYHFTAEQSEKVGDEERAAWIASAHKSGNRPDGKRWYADTSKEPIRDDLIRYGFLVMGAVGKQTSDTHSTTASTPIYFLAADFAALFDPSLDGVELNRLIEKWRAEHLSVSTLQRMALRAQGAKRSGGELFVELPNGERLRISSGASNEIVKDLVEQFAPLHLKNPAVLWISASDRKAYPQFQEISESLGLTFDVGAELPDLILADLEDPTTFYFCEVVATDGPVSDARKAALLAIVSSSKIEERNVRFVTAFEDREAAPVRKLFSRLATDSLVWFRTEPSTIVIISSDTRWVSVP